jgi:hypothetical protein
LLVGVLINAIYPWNALLALLGLWTLTDFVAALGTYVSLRSATTPAALGWTLGLLIALNSASLIVYYPVLWITPWHWLAGCMPEILYQLPAIALVEIFAGWGGVQRPVVFLVLNCLAYGLAGRALRFAAIREFDTLVNRPRRGRRSARRLRQRFDIGATGPASAGPEKHQSFDGAGLRQALPANEPN